MQQFFAMKVLTIDIFCFFKKWTIKISRRGRYAVRKTELLVYFFIVYDQFFFRKNERHCFTLGVVKNYFAHLSILKRYFSNLSHFYSGRSPSVMHDSNRLNCTLFYSHPQNAFIYVTCLSESRFSRVIESCGWQSNLLPALALQRSPLPLTKRALQAGVKVKLYS